MAIEHEVVCGAHGKTRIAHACKHVANGIACGFHGTKRDAWCDACEEASARERVVLCARCWDDAKTRNAHIPELARGRATRLDDDELQRLLGGACTHLEQQQASARRRWRFDELPAWAFDDARRTLTFSDGSPRVVADARLVGSYSTRSQTFQWSWVLFDPGEPLIRGIADLRAFGEVRGVSWLTKNYWHCEIEAAWEMTALAAYLTGAEAAYRAPFEDIYWFMLLDGFRAAT